MPHEPTLPTLPHSAFRFVFVPAYRTLAACSSFRASEALDAGLLALVGQIIDIFSIFPLRHALVVMASFVLSSYPMRVADEEGAYLLLLTEVDHLACRFM